MVNGTSFVVHGAKDPETKFTFALYDFDALSPEMGATIEYAVYPPVTVLPTTLLGSTLMVVGVLVPSVSVIVTVGFALDSKVTNAVAPYVVMSRMESVPMFRKSCGVVNDAGVDVKVFWPYGPIVTVRTGAYVVFGGRLSTFTWNT